MPQISIIIITCNRPVFLKRLLENITGLLRPGLDTELIIVDSSDHSDYRENRRAILAHFPLARHIRTAKNKPLQRNAGITHSHNQYILFLDDDVVLQPDYISGLLKCFLTKDAVGATGYVTNQKQYPIVEKLFRKLFLLQDINNKYTYRKLSGYHSFLMTPKKGPRETTALWGCNMMINRAVFKYISFDNSLCFFDDLDISLSLRTFGKPYICDTAMVRHDRSTLHRKQPWIVLWQQMTSNWYILRKHQRIQFANILAIMWSSIGMAFLIITAYAFNLDLTKGTFRQ